MKIKNGDNVIVIAGADKGKSGKVIKVDSKKNRVVVEGVNLRKKHQKPNSINPDGGIVEGPMAIAYSNVMLIDPDTKTATRTKVVFEGDKKKRIAVKSGKEIK